MQDLYDHLISERKKVKKALKERRGYWNLEASKRELSEFETERRWSSIKFKEGQLDAINHVLKYIRNQK